MAAIQALYLQDPFWLWLALACLFVSLSVSTGSSLTMWPGLAAVSVAVLELAGLRLGPVAETGVFVALSLGVLGFLFGRRPKTVAAGGGSSTGGGGGGHRPAHEVVTGGQDHTARLVGRIGRSSGEFINGIGRVWIDGAEWGAELEGGEELPDGAPVRIARVIGGVRLMVHPLNTG